LIIEEENEIFIRVYSATGESGVPAPTWPVLKGDGRRVYVTMRLPI